MKINESGMTFGEYSEENYFHIKKSTTIAVINDQKARDLGLLTSEQFDKAVRPGDMVGPN